MATNKLGDNNIAIGYGAMDLSYIDDTQDALTDNNIFIGKDSGGGDWATAASFGNVAIGNLTMDGILNGAQDNTAVGHGAMSTLLSGDKNICIGKNAGNHDVNMTSGYGNVIIGADADVSTAGAINQIVLGRDCSGQADNSVTLGNADVTDVYMAKDSGAIVHSGALVNGLSAILLTSGTLAYATHSIVRGKYVTVSADAQTIDLPQVIIGAVFIIVNIAADGGALLTIDPHNDDKFLLDIAGAAGTDGTSISNTKATQNQGDFVKLVGMSGDGWAITEIGGIWADD
jgi:hypothetical protein